MDLKGKQYVTDNEELLSEWHFKKNVNVEPRELSLGCNQKVWWLGKCGHEWDAIVRNRSNGQGCPYCKNKRLLQGFNDLATTHPELAKQWHPTKNDDLKPNEVVFGSGKKVWWLCEQGHEWETTIVHRVNNRGCPYCSNKKVWQGFNDLATTHPELAKQWHPTKNDDLKPTEVVAGSNKKIWWQCEQGHEWKTDPNSRVYSNSGCPYCGNSGTSYPEQCLFYYLSKIFPTTKNRYQFKLENKSVELDIYIPEISLALEYDGSYWHKNKKASDLKKSELIRDKLSLIRIREKGLDPIEGDFCILTGSSETEIETTIKKVFDFILKKFSLAPTVVDLIQNTSVNLLRDGVSIREDYLLRKKEMSLLATYPELSKEWHPHKNKSLLPKNFSPNSSVKAWWLCEKGHEWQAVISSRSSGGKCCPYCSNTKTLKGFNDLATTHPELAKQWHPTKNGDLKPYDFISGSHKKVWWLCEEGHEWDATIHNRVRGSGCPYCSNKKILKGFNDLATTHPELAKQWHPTKNDRLKPTEIVAGSNKKIWWQCEQGHEWKTAPNSRIYSNSGCPYCGNKKIQKDFNDLATTHLELAKQWHPTKNNNLSPENVTFGSCEKVWWLCEKGHEWETTPNSRVSNNSSCPYCSNQKVLKGFNDLVTTHPELAKQWHPIKNENLNPENLTFGSTKKVWWLCEHGHEWDAIIGNRAKGTGCPYCTNQKVLKGFNDLATTHPELAKQWHPTKNDDLKPHDVLYGSPKKVWWLCEHGHDWQTTIASRADGRGCPYCTNQKVLKGFNDLVTTHPELAKQWHHAKNGDLKPHDIVCGSGRRVWWLCEHGHEWQTIVADRLNRIDRTSITKCPYCSNKKVWQGFNDLATTHPELAKQWHPTKNGDLKPSKIIAGSHKRIWWICEYGHEWETKCYSNVKNPKCPKCREKEKEL